MLVAPSRLAWSACARGFGKLLVELVFDFSDDLFEHVFDGEQTGYGAEFIHDHRHVRVLLAELLEHLHERFGFGNDERLAHDVREIERRRGPPGTQVDAPLMPEAQHVFEEDSADDLFRLVFPDGQARVLAFDHGGEDVVERGSGGDRDDVAARLHDFAHVEVVEIEHAVDHVLLKLGEVAGEAAGTDDEFEFFRRVSSAAVAASSAHAGG